MADDIMNDKAKGAPNKSTAAGKGSKSAKPSASGKSAKAVAKPAATTSKVEGLGLPKQVDLMWAVAFVVVAFVLGFFAHALFAGGTDTGVTASQTLGYPSATPSQSGGASALSQDQLGGPLPQGHPSVGGSTATTAPASATAPATAPSSIDNGFTHTPDALKSSLPPKTKSDVPAAAGSLTQQSVDVPKDKDPNNVK